MIANLPLGWNPQGGLLNFSPKRSIGGIVADATIEEIHQDQLTITEHPVEQGAAIADHAYKRPAEVIIRAGWSSSSPSALFNPSYLREVYDKLLKLQADRELIDVLTGKRDYPNMLIETLALTTDEKTENALMLTVRMRQVILVSTQTVTVPSDDVQQSPQSTGNIQNMGTIQPVPSSPSS